MILRLKIVPVFSLFLSVQAFAFSGKEAASFLDIPVGARPTALGAAYSALASDSYAMTYNPAGLAFAATPEFAAQHLAYLESIHYESASAVYPGMRWGSVGASIQYLGSGDMRRTDVTGKTIGEFSSHYAAYALGVARPIGSRMSFGVSGKLIEAKIADVRATAMAVDAGALFRVNPQLNLALVATQWGSRLTFLENGDLLPRAVRVGASYAFHKRVLCSAEGVYRPDGPESAHLGAEWIPVQGLALRAGYRSDLQKESGGLAGISAGIGMTVWNQELAYAWVPYGDLGMTQTISFVARLGAGRDAKNLAFQPRPRLAQSPEMPRAPSDFYYDYSELIDESLTGGALR